MNVLPLLVHGCEIRTVSRSDNFTVQRMEQHASDTRNSSFFLKYLVAFIDLNLEV